MGFEDTDLVEYAGKAASSSPCSICLEDVTDYGGRASAKLNCGHQFHLDCIGSAFNVKGVMQCPNCRKIEKGQWLYADGGRPYPELNIDDLVNDEDVYDLTYSESSMWCPYGSFAQLAAAFDEVEYPTTAYHDIVGPQQHGAVSEHATTVSSSSATHHHHICPYIAYVQPTNVAAEGPRYNNNNNSQWNGQSASSEIPNSYGLHYNTNTTLFPTPTTHHPSMPPRTNADMSRPGSYAHTVFATQSSGARPPRSPMNHRPYVGGSGARGAVGEPFFRQQQQPMRAPASNVNVIGGGGGGGLNQVGGAPPSAGGGGVYFVGRSFQESESSMLNLFHHISERDHPLPPHQHPVERGVTFHQAGVGGFRQRHHGSERRMPLQTQYWL